MDNKKIEKLINCELNTPDNILGKSFLLNKYPAIKREFRAKADSTKFVYREQVEKLGFKLGPGKHVLQFEDDSFPELY